MQLNGWRVRVGERALSLLNTTLITETDGRHRSKEADSECVPRRSMSRHSNAAVEPPRWHVRRVCHDDFDRADRPNLFDGALDGHIRTNASCSSESERWRWIDDNRVGVGVSPSIAIYRRLSPQIE